MNTRRMVLSIFVGSIVSLFISQAVVAQTEKLGVVRYTPPKGWVKSAKEHAVVFSGIDQAAGRFCFITLYGAGPGTGNPQSDFVRAWSERVVQPWGGEANPKPETIPDNGWTTVAAGAPDDVIPEEIFTNPLQGANLNKKWARKK